MSGSPVEIYADIKDISALEDPADATSFQFLVSQYFQSKHIALSDFATCLSDDLEILRKKERLHELSAAADNRISYLQNGHWIYGNNQNTKTYNELNFKNGVPYFTYGYAQLSNANIISNSYFSVFDGMSSVFAHHIFDDISSNAISAATWVGKNIHLTRLYAKELSASDISAESATFNSVTAETLSAKQGTINDVSASGAKITSLTATNSNLSDLSAKKLSVNHIHCPNSAYMGGLHATHFQTQKIAHFVEGLSGEILYLHPNGVVIKQPIVNTDVLVCESPEDLSASRLCCEGQTSGYVVDAEGTPPILSVYDGSWSSKGDPFLSCGVGRICFNKATKKCFYVRSKSFEKIGGDDYTVKNMTLTFVGRDGTTHTKIIKTIEE